jgi:hypothetical protein
MRDDFDSVVADRFKLLDDVPAPDVWSRVEFKLLDPTPARFTEGDAAMIDLEPPLAIDQRRKGPKRVAVAALVAAAAVISIALVAIRRDDPVSPADQPSPTVTVPPTVALRPLFGTGDERFVPGTYFVDEVGGSPTPRIFVTLPDGWRNSRDKGAVRNDDIGVITFSRPFRVFSDACHANDGFHPGPVTTVDGLVAALSEQSGWLNVTAPTDISVNGYPGKTFQRTAPADFTGCTQTGDTPFRSFDDGGRPGGWPYYERGEIETLQVLDVNGTIIMIASRSKLGHQDAAAVAGLAAVLDSIRIEQT